MKPRIVLLVAILIAMPAAAPAQAPKIIEFRTQTVNGKTYFHVRMERPKDMKAIPFRDALRGLGFGEFDFLDSAVRPRLVPQDDAARLVYGSDRGDERFDARMGPRFDKGKEPPPPAVDPKDDKKPVEEPKKVDKDLDGKKKEFDDKEKGPLANDGDGPRNNDLEFYGVFTGKKPATFLLMYPQEPPVRDKKKKKLSLHELLQDKSLWVEVKVTLDPAKAKKTPIKPGQERKEDRPVDPSDLEGNWAIAQAAHFTQLQNDTPDFGFFSFASETTSRLYKVRGPSAPWRPEFGRIEGPDGQRHGEVGRLYEITTGAAAITESLALDRLRDRGFNDKQEPRTVPIADVPGIDIDEHPWQKMMGKKKPAAEPLANMIPHDNYYVRFNTFQKFLDTADLLDQWGTTIARAFEANSRDYRIKQKLEQQICLKSTGLARTFGPAVIKSMAITGNDPYLREGSDFTVIFQLNSKLLFDTGAAPNLAEARKKFGAQLKEEKEKYQGVTIDSFTTPLREVSLHRAYFGDVAVFSNSPVAVRRVIDAQKGKIKRLADSLDFQYMRTIFRADDPDEDGFVFLSDAFIRNLVGPRVRIKERRRLEALTSLSMLHHGAMFTAWETGKLPQSFQHILTATGMNPNELFSPDGNAVAWDAEKSIAVSSFYNTLHFATPLIEIPLDRVSPSEAREYNMFRAQYLGLWRQYFDPIGIRLSLKADQIKMDTYILPLVRNTQYNELRRIAGDGTIKIDSTMFSDKTLFKYLMHVSPRAFEGDLFGGAGNGWIVDLALRSWLGDWFAVRFDDSPIYAKLLESYIRREMFPEEQGDGLDDLELALQLPVTIGFDVRSPVVFAGVLTATRKSVENTLPGAVEWGPMKEPYKGVNIVRIKANGERVLRNGIVGPDGRRIDPEFYYALIDGAFFLSLREEPIKDIIDKSVVLKERKGKGENIEVNSSLYLGPKAAVQSKELLKFYLEYETHHRAQRNNRLLYALFKSNAVGPADDSPAVEAAALQYLGFVPVSPDLAPFRYDWQKEEVVNLRHGSLRQPKLHKGIEAKSPLGVMLEEFTSIRAELRFREDGIHTTLTMSKNVAAPAKGGKIIKNVRGAAYRAERRSELKQIGLFYVKFCDEIHKADRTLDRFLDYIKSAAPLRDAIKEGYYVVNLSAEPTKMDSIIAYERDEDNGRHLCVRGDTTVMYVPAVTLKKALAK